MLTVRGLQHLFSTHERVLLWKCRSFWDRKCLDRRGTRTTNLRIHAKCSTLLSYQGQTFAVPCFWTLAIIMISKNVIICAIINDWVTLWTESVIIRRPTQTRLLILFGEKIKKILKYLMLRTYSGFSSPTEKSLRCVPPNSCRKRLSPSCWYDI